MKILLSIILLLSLHSLAFATGDQRPDVMGFYFDQSYPMEDRSAPANTPFFLYAVVTNPTMSSLDGFEFGYAHEVPAGMEGLVFRLATNYPPGDIGLHPVKDLLSGSYYVGVASPFPLSSYTVLMSWQYMLLGNFVMGFQITGADPSSMPGGLPGYGLDQELVPCYIAETCFTTGAYVNTWCPLPTEPLSWGTLKGLYR